MSEFTITEADVEATTEFIAAVASHVENVDVDEAVTFRHLLEQHKAKVNLVISLIDSALIQRLESAQIRDGVEYRVGPKPEKVRFDHARILGVLQAKAKVDEETGEIFDTDEALARLAASVIATYLSPSAEAKVGGMKRYGINRNSVQTNEWGGEKVFVTPIQYTNGGET